MITQFQMYLLCMLDNINSMAAIMLFVSCGIAGVAWFISCMMKADGNVNESGSLLLAAKLSFLVFAINIAIIAFLPNTKQMAAIIIIPKIVNNEKIQDCASSLVDLANDWMKELSPKKDGEK